MIEQPESRDIAPLRRPRILVVDDEPMNRDLLAAFLHESGYELIEAASGIQAIKELSESRPDLVLLDVMMPGLDGFETTKQLKLLARDTFLPIVLVTALGDSASRVRGYEAGADEFLTKPINRHELLARLRTLLHLRYERQALAEKNEHLRKLQQFREQATSLLVHDLKNPLGALSLNLDYAAQMLAGTGAPSHALDALEDARDASRRLLRRITEALDTARAEEGHLVARRKQIRPSELLQLAAREFERGAKENRVSVQVVAPETLQFPLDQDLMLRVMENLLENALRFTPGGGRIELFARQQSSSIEMGVCNEGEPIALELRPRLFDRYFQGATGERGGHRGLGLYFCRLAVEAHGGRIDVIEVPPYSTCFRAAIPSGPCEH